MGRDGGYFLLYIIETGENIHTRRSICKLHISAHKLNIEVGRYNKTPRNERFCKKCNTGEMHFLLLCNHFEIDRKNILDLVAGEVKNFHTLSCENKLIFLMNNENISIFTL
jgi:hypothetical protein